MCAVAADAPLHASVQYAEADFQRAELQFSFDQEDYAAVVRSAPAALEAAGRVAAEVERQRHAGRIATGSERVFLVCHVPELLASARRRLDAISSGRKDAAGVDVGASQSTLADATTQWDVARATSEAGHTNDAIPVAPEVKLELDTGAAVMKVPAPRVDP